MLKRFQSEFLSGTIVLRWIINLLLLPPATAFGIANVQNVWQIDRDNSAVTFSLGLGAETLQVGLARVRCQVVRQSEGSSPRRSRWFRPSR